MKRFIPFMKSDPVVPVIRLQGTIVASGRNAGLNDAGLAPLIEKAFRKGKPAGVALVINSPGGSPTQSSLIAARIRRLADEHKVTVHAFVEDIAASGGYWLACAADEIFVDENSIVGSIGVISSGFGFQDLIARHGIERRVYTAGKSKSMLDPFKPENPDDIARLKELQEQIHASFITHVQTRRGDRLSDGDLFNGDIWVGQKSIDAGLADGLGHLVPKMKDVYGEKVKLVPYRQRRPFFGRLGAKVVEDTLLGIEDRAMWARFGL